MHSHGGGLFKTGKFGLTRLRFLSDASTSLSLALLYLTLAWRVLVHQILYLPTLPYCFLNLRAGISESAVKGEEVFIFFIFFISQVKYLRYSKTSTL